MTFQFTRVLDHTDTQQSVGILYMSDQLVAEISDNTQHLQETDNPAPGGIRKHNLCRRTAEDLRLKPRGCLDMQGQHFVYQSATAPRWAKASLLSKIRLRHTTPVGLLWTSDQLVVDSLTTLTTDRHPCPRRDSNPRLRPRGHWDLQGRHITQNMFNWILNYTVERISFNWIFSMFNLVVRIHITC
jgi:hypothetical protein